MVKGKTPLLIAVVLGLLAFVVAWSAIRKREQDVRAGWNLTPVVVAAVDLSEGTVITLDMMSRRSIPDQFVSGSVVRPDSASMLVGQKVLVPLQAGDPVLWSQFDSSRASERLANKVQPRARAVTIAAQGTSAVGGFVRPNDHIDVLGTFKDPSTGEQVALTLLQNVVVLATGKMTGTTNVNLLTESERAYTNISLLVMPEEAEVLTLAQELGALTLSLRNDTDVTMLANRRRTTIQTLFDHERLERMGATRPQSVVIIRGNVTGSEQKP